MMSLWYAAANGYKAVVKQLLATGKVNIDLRDQSGRTPLSWAAGNGHEAVVKRASRSFFPDLTADISSVRDPHWPQESFYETVQMDWSVSPTNITKVLSSVGSSKAPGEGPVGGNCGDLVCRSANNAEGR
jgi:ankyrin repeat protein